MSTETDEPRPAAVTGYRQLSAEQVDLMNRIKALGNEVGKLIDELRRYPATPPGVELSPSYYLRLDQRAVSIGATEAQQAFMWLSRAVAQPTSFA